MMSFKDFFFEAIKSSGARGDAMEAIFAIAIALYISDGYINIDKLNNIKNTVQLKTKEKNLIPIDSNLADNTWIQKSIPTIKPGNRIAVVVEVNIKETAKEIIGKIANDTETEQSIQQLVNNWSQTKSCKRIEDYIVKILTDRHPDSVVFKITADGVNNVHKGDTIKGDVRITVEAISKETDTINIPPITFSLKTEKDGIKVASPSIFNTLIQLGKNFNLPLSRGLDQDSFLKVSPSQQKNLLFHRPQGEGGKYAELADDPNHILHYVRAYVAISTKEKSEENKALAIDALVKLINYVFEKVENQFVQSSVNNPEEFTKNTYNFLANKIFGIEDTTLIHITKSSLSELSKEDFIQLKNTYNVVELSKHGNNLIFIGINKDTKERERLFTMMPRIDYGKAGNNSIDIHLGSAFKNF